jgi:hypothetical protein
VRVTKRERQLKSFAMAAVAVVAAPLSQSKASAPLPKPAILFMGQDISGTTQHIRVGEQVVLATSPSPLQCLSQAWAVAKGLSDPIGGFNISASCPPSPMVNPTPCDGPIAADFSDPTTTFFFIAPGTYDIAYRYAVGGKSAGSTAAFKVDGPTNVVVTAATGLPQVTTNDSNNYLMFGNKFARQPGIEFTVKADEAGGGKFFWAQVLTFNFYEFGINGTTIKCDALSGLDNSFPYAGAIQPEANDSPNIKITKYTLGFDSVSAYMYSFWQSDTPMSIPVPMGDVFWSVSMGTAKVNGVWEQPSYNIIPPIVVPGYVPYPQWFSVAYNRTPCKAKALEAVR